MTGLKPDKDSSVLGKVQTQRGKLVYNPGDLGDGGDGKPIAILVHGLASDVGENFMGLYRLLEPHFEIFAFSYPTISRSISDNARDLAAEVKRLKAKYPQRSIYIFAHSMGGLVARSAIIQNEMDVEHVLTAGTPHNGASIGKGLLFLYSLWDWSIPHIPLTWANPLSRSPGIQDLCKNTRFIQRLNHMEHCSTNFLKYFAMGGNILRLRRGSSDSIVGTDNATCLFGGNFSSLRLQGVVDEWTHFSYFKEGYLLNNAISSALHKMGITSKALQHS